MTPVVHLLEAIYGAYENGAVQVYVITLACGGPTRSGTRVSTSSGDVTCSACVYRAEGAGVGGRRSPAVLP